jgi:hypothetical protein
MAKDKWIVEIYRNGSYRKRRVFRSREEAIGFINDWQDDHDEHPDPWDLQIVHGTVVEQTGINGNNR